MADGAGPEWQATVSRTEKTNPYWVKRFEFNREVHNHRKGFCNLPASARVQGDEWRETLDDCYYDCDWNHPIYRCGCYMCGYPSQSKALRRTDRKAIREGLADFHEEDE